MDLLEVLNESLKRRFIANSVIKNIEDTILRKIEEPLRKSFEDCTIQHPNKSGRKLDIVDYSVVFNHTPGDTNLTQVHGIALSYRCPYNKSFEEAKKEYLNSGKKIDKGIWVEADYSIERFLGENYLVNLLDGRKVKVKFSNARVLEPDK